MSNHRTILHLCDWFHLTDNELHQAPFLPALVLVQLSSSVMVGLAFSTSWLGRRLGRLVDGRSLDIVGRLSFSGTIVYGC